MIRKLAFAALAATTVLIHSVALAQSVTFKPIEEKNLASGKQRLDPAKAYIFVHAPLRTFGLFIKGADAEDRALYESEWRKALAEAIEDFPKEHARWVRDNEINEQVRIQTGKVTKMRPEPVMPTESNFSIPELERRLMISYGPSHIYSKGTDYFSYLVEVEPGTYTFYGPVMGAANAMGGTCYCMGSVQFDAPAGKIANLGDFLALRWITGEQGKATNIAFDPSLVSSRAVDYTLPPSLAAFPSQQAELRAAGKMNNFFGVMIGRMPPVPGVLGYERGRVIDLKAAPE